MRSQELAITDVVNRAANQNAPQMPHITEGPEKHKGLAEAKPLLNLVGVRGFEPPTPSSRTRLPRWLWGFHSILQNQSSL